MFVCCECCVLSGRGLCDELITRPEESYRLWRVVVCDQETSKTRRLKPATGLWKIRPQCVAKPGKQTNKQTYYWSGCRVHILRVKRLKPGPDHPPLRKGYRLIFLLPLCALMAPSGVKVLLITEL
jgi:hypothetical protein